MNNGLKIGSIYELTRSISFHIDGKLVELQPPQMVHIAGSTGRGYIANYAQSNGVIHDESWFQLPRKNMLKKHSKEYIPREIKTLAKDGAW